MSWSNSLILSQLHTHKGHVCENQNSHCHLYMNSHSFSILSIMSQAIGVEVHFHQNKEDDGGVYYWKLICHVLSSCLDSTHLMEFQLWVTWLENYPYPIIMLPSWGETGDSYWCYLLKRKIPLKYEKFLGGPCRQSLVESLLNEEIHTDWESKDIRGWLSLTQLQSLWLGFGFRCPATLVVTEFMIIVL